MNRDDRVERFERDLTDVLREIAGEEAPMSLRYRLSDITERAPIGRRLWFATPMRLSVVAVTAVAVLALAVLFWPRTEVGPVPSDSPEPSPIQSVEPSPSPSDEPTPSVAPTAAPTPMPTVTPTIAPTPAPTTPATGEWTGLVWSDPVTPSFTVFLEDLLPWGDGYVAVGMLPLPDGRGEAAFLTSQDGLHWTVTYRTDPGNSRYPLYLEAFDGKLFAFSNPDYDHPFSGVVPAAPPLVWQSSDGRTWSLVESRSWQAAWDAGWMFGRVESGPGGLVATGNHLAGDPAVLHSVDGVAWTETSIPGLLPQSRVGDVIAFDDGFALLGGTEDSTTNGPGRPQAWFSDDGLTWVSVPVVGENDGNFQRDSLGAPHAGATGLIARSELQCAGCVEGPATWISTDGRSWHRDAALGVDAPEFGLWASDGTRILVLGEWGTPMILPPPSEPPPGLTTAQMSTDGMTWTALTLSHPMTDNPEEFWVVPNGVIYAGQQSFWFGTPVIAP